MRAPICPSPTKPSVVDPSPLALLDDDVPSCRRTMLLLLPAAGGDALAWPPT